MLLIESAFEVASPAWTGQTPKADVVASPVPTSLLCLGVGEQRAPGRVGCRGAWAGAGAMLRWWNTSPCRAEHPLVLQM